MGSNAAIKRFDAAHAGQPLELFDTKRSRMPVVLGLFASPWIVRASELARADGTCASKRVAEAVAVVWDAHGSAPAEFVRDDQRYRIDAVVQTWATERAWWDMQCRVARRYYRVAACGGVYDLAFDCSTGAWLLVGVHD